MDREACNLSTRGEKVDEGDEVFEMALVCLESQHFFLVFPWLVDDVCQFGVVLVVECGLKRLSFIQKNCIY